MLSTQLPESHDGAKLARESLKNLTAEDFTQLALSEPIMEQFEGKYTEMQGTSFENELAKIMRRFNSEGKNEQMLNDSRNKKKVRIHEEAKYDEGGMEDN